MKAVAEKNEIRCKSFPVWFVRLFVCLFVLDLVPIINDHMFAVLDAKKNLSGSRSQKNTQCLPSALTANLFRIEEKGIFRFPPGNTPWRKLIFSTLEIILMGACFQSWVKELL